VRTYDAKPWDGWVNGIKDELNSKRGINLDCCFINGYNDEKDSLGWHADDSPEMNPDEPVVVISLGAERNIMFRNYETREIQTVRLGHGSLCIMPPGFQQTHQHKIPKGDHADGAAHLAHLSRDDCGRARRNDGRCLGAARMNHVPLADGLRR
jgi:alkylated DNA repair dioxygenase AlkB